MHVAKHDSGLRVSRQDCVRRAKRVVQRVQEDPAHEVHHEHLVAAGLDHARSLTRSLGRIVGGPQHALQVRQLADELLLREDVVAARDHVRTRAFQLGRDLACQAKATRRVLAVEDREVGPQLLLEAWKQGFDGFPSGMSDNIGDEQNLELALRHHLILVEKEKGARFRAPLVGYFAYSTALVSRTTVTRIWPGKLSSDSMRLAMSRAMS